MEDYLKAIFHFQDEAEVVTTVALAARLQVAAPSVTNMVKRLAGMGLVLHSPYGGIQLTPRGRAVAVEVVRHHRLIEAYLAQFLDIPWERVHDEAERLEHVISEDLEQRMATKLGEPRVDPHGHPIPTYDGALDTTATIALWDVPTGSRAVVAQVSDRDPDLLAYLPSLDLFPGSVLKILDVSPYSGTQTLLAGDRRHTIGSELARAIRVRQEGTVET